MNKKILAICTFLIVALSISAVSAFDLGDLFGDSADSQAENVTIDGISFRVPEGYKEDPSLSINGDINESGEGKFTTWEKTFDNKNDVISIAVLSYDGFEVDEDLPSYLGGDKMSVNGVDGYKYEAGPLDGFAYAKDGKLVIIALTDSSLLKDII